MRTTTPGPWQWPMVGEKSDVYVEIPHEPSDEFRVVSVDMVKKEFGQHLQQLDESVDKFSPDDVTRILSDFMSAANYHAVIINDDIQSLLDDECSDTAVTHLEQAGRAPWLK